MEADEAPEEPHLFSEPSLMSPASPKPIHIPTPTNIPVLNKMMDVSFNQTEIHMQDPSMRNTDVRDGAWKEPEAEEQTIEEMSTIVPQAESTENIADATASDVAMNAAHDDGGASTSITSEAVPAIVPDETVTNIATNLTETADSTLDSSPVHLAPNIDPIPLPSVNAAEPQIDGQEQPAAVSVLPSNVDVQSLLSFLQRAPQSATPSALPAPATPLDAVAAPVANSSKALESPVNGELNTQLGNVQVQEANAQAVPGADLANALSVTASAVPHADLTAALLAATPSNATAAFIPTSRAPSSQRERKLAAGEPVTEDDAPWNADIQMKYDDFIQEERKHVNAGNWDQFPHGSRLFVGNLSSDSVTKRDIFHVFHSYGPLAQISIKQAYGFVQFLYADDCARALTSEQGRHIKDKKIHLEVSKPQKSRNNQNNQNNNRNRSRSPANRRRNERESNRYRSPSPRSGYRDRYDDRRSRTPPGYGRNRYGRSPSPQNGDDLPLPRRAPQDVPDVQVIVRDSLDRDFIGWVEKAFVARGVRIAVLILNPRLNEDAVIRRQIVEGVLAVSRLDRQAQNTGKINLRVFNRSRGINNVSFDDYDNLDPSICAELVLRARSQAAPQASYGYSAPQGYAPPPQPAQYGYGMPQQPQYSAPPPQAYPQQGYAPQYSAMPPQMPPAPGQPQHLDMGSLQNLLATARNGGPQGPGVQPSVPQGFPPGYPAQQATSYATAPPQQQQNYGGYPPNTPTFTTVPQQTAAPPEPVNMQDILARLGNYGK